MIYFSFFSSAEASSPLPRLAGGLFSLISGESDGNIGIDSITRSFVLDLGNISNREEGDGWHLSGIEIMANSVSQH